MSNGDPFNCPDYLPVLSTAGLQLVDESLPVRLSLLLAFNDFRRSQIARSLECLARQTWREFEVLIHDNGSSLPMEPVYEMFRPYLRLTTVRAERTRSEMRMDPSFGIKALLPLARGEVIAFACPEIMFARHAMYLLWSAHKEPPLGSLRYIISNPGVPMGGRPTWVSLKVGFFDADCQHFLDGINWHSDLQAVEDLPTFWTHGQSSGNYTGREILALNEWPWSQCGSAPRSDRIWEDMPAFKRYASLDFFLLGYRHVRGYVDIVPPGLQGYHQDHYRIPDKDIEGEAAGVSVYRLREGFIANGVSLCPPPDPDGADLSPVIINPPSRGEPGSTSGIFIGKDEPKP